MNDQILGFLLVALLWGGTNPWIKRASNGFESKGFLNLLMKPSYLIPFLLNLSGSLAYYWFLSEADVSVAAPVTNALTLSVTMIMGWILGENVNIFRTVIGSAFIAAGVYFTTNNKQN